MPTTKGKSTSKRSTTSSENRKSRAESSRSSHSKPNTSNGRSKMLQNGSDASAEVTDNSQLEKLFTDALKDIYWAEKHLIKALPKMQKAATTEELKSAIEEHLSQTEEHVTRLEQVFELCGKKPQAKKCDGMEGLIKEGESVVAETEEETMTRDAGIIMSAQKVEHYEIAAYGTLAQLARTLGMDEAAGLLDQTLEEEKEADQKLTEIAEGSINQSASQEEEEESDEEEEQEDDEKKKERK